MLNRLIALKEKHMQPCPIIVETYFGDSDEPESERQINHSDPLHRKWLGSHTFWALRNGREVRTYPVEE